MASPENPVTWELKDGRTIYLITPDELSQLDDGEYLWDIFGKPHIKGVDRIDDDTRGGYLAYGLLSTDPRFQGEKP